MEIKNLSKGYNTGNVIKNITISLAPGMIYGLIGPNGCGKSTLLRCLTGAFRTEKGQVKILDMDVFDNSDAKRKIAFVEDQPVFNYFFDIKQQMKYYHCYYEDFSVEKFDLLLDQFSLNKKAMTNSLSLGQKKKLALALALSRKPEYLILDEPENGLDNEARIVLREYLREVAEQGGCVLVASHDLNNIEGLCDEILFMKEGQVLHQLSVEEMFAGLSKWSVKTNKKSFSDAIILAREGEFVTVVARGNRVITRERLEQEGAEVLNPEKISLLDAYMMYKEGENYENK